jgi:hypothetical protein
VSAGDIIEYRCAPAFGKTEINPKLQSIVFNIAEALQICLMPDKKLVMNKQPILARTKLALLSSPSDDAYRSMSGDCAAGGHPAYDEKARCCLIDQAKLGIAARRLDANRDSNMAAETESLVFAIEAMAAAAQKQSVWEQHAKAVIRDRDDRISDLEAEAQIRTDRAAKRKRKMKA